MAFEGPVPVAFAFQAVQLVFDDSGEFLTTQQLPAGDAAARALKPAALGGPGAVRCFWKLAAHSCAHRSRRHMNEKRLTVILYGCDRNLWRGGPLQLRISDVFAAGGPRPLYEGRSEAATIELRLQLPFDAGQVYGFTFSAPGHRPAWQLVRRLDFIRAGEQVEGDDLILRLMLVPDSPGTTDLPQAFERLQQIASPFAAAGTGITADAFQALDVAAKMAFLNIEAKLRETSLDGSPLMSFVKGVRHVAVDRVFLLFDPALKARMPRASDFADAPGHEAPKNLPHLPDHPDSWKHVRFAEGNIQLSFSKDAAPIRRCRHRSCTLPTWTSISAAGWRTRRSGSRTTSSGRATRRIRRWSTRSCTRRASSRDTRSTRCPRRRAPCRRSR